jgi:hypothetical protein
MRWFLIHLEPTYKTERQNLQLKTQQNLVSQTVSLQLSSLVCRIKVSLITNVSLPYFRYEIWPTFPFVVLKHYKFYYWFYIFRINIRGGTASNGGAVSIFDLSLYEKHFLHRHFPTFVQRLVPFFHKSDDNKCVSSLNVNLYTVDTNTQLSAINIDLS